MKAGVFVNLYLSDPIEKVWGRLYELSQVGVFIRGIDPKSVEAFRYQFQKEDKTVFPTTTFWPMHRVLRIDLDEALDTVPSVIETIKRTTGLSEDEIIEPPICN